MPEEELVSDRLRELEAELAAAVRTSPSLQLCQLLAELHKLRILWFCLTHQERVTA
jgi:hypothetical protein